MKAYLIDTNVLISLFSVPTEQRVKHLLKTLNKKSILYLCGPVLSEFYQGIDRKNAEYYSALLDEFPYLHSNRAIYENTGLMAHELKKQGWTAPLGDCMIAQISKHYQAEVVTFDKHFLHFKGIKVKFFRL